MPERTDHNEAMRLADLFELEPDPESLYRQAASLLRQQAERIAELELQPAFAQLASDLAEKLSATEAERDQLRAEVERLREFFDADMAVAKIYDEVSPGLTSPKGAEWSDRVEAAIARRCAAVIAIEAAKEAK